jgi:negative regulator of flagellin synthesis FlgM
MKIGSDHPLVNLEAYIKNAQNSEGLKPSLRQGTEKSIQTESVKLSSTARKLQKAREILAATPEIRDDKVGQFKREIESGTYDVRGDKVAEKMLMESLIDAFV